MALRNTWAGTPRALPVALVPALSVATWMLLLSGPSVLDRVKLPSGSKAAVTTVWARLMASTKLCLLAKPVLGLKMVWPLMAKGNCKSILSAGNLTRLVLLLVTSVGRGRLRETAAPMNLVLLLASLMASAPLESKPAKTPCGSLALVKLRMPLLTVAVTPVLAALMALANSDTEVNPGAALVMVLPYRLSGKLKFNWSAGILICVALTAENVTSGRFMLTVPPNKPAGMPSALPSVFTPLGLVSIWMLLPSLLRSTKAPSRSMLANTPVTACWPLMALIRDCLLLKRSEPTSKGMACPLMAKLPAK